MKKHEIKKAITDKRLLQFRYKGSTRVVEPHQLAYNDREHLALSAWWIRGHSESGRKDNRWREYLLEDMSAVTLLDEFFEKPRKGYKRTPNDLLHRVVAQL